MTELETQRGIPTEGESDGGGCSVAGDGKFELDGVIGLGEFAGDDWVQVEERLLLAQFGELTLDDKALDDARVEL